MSSTHGNWIVASTTYGIVFVLSTKPRGVFIPDQRIAMLAAMSAKRGVAFAPGLEKPFRGCLGVVINFKEIAQPCSTVVIGETELRGVCGDTPEQAVAGFLGQMVVTPITLAT